MHKILIAFGLIYIVFTGWVSADALKDSLTTILNEKDTSGMVNLDNINLNGKPKPALIEQKVKKRSGKVVIATVNGESIRKNEADSYLNKVTQGKVKDFDRLPKQQRVLLIHELARPMLLKQAIKKELSTEEKTAIYRQMWLRKKMSTTEVSNEEMLVLYESMKKQALAQNPQAQIPPYISLGDKLKNQAREQKIVAQLMKDVKIEVNYD